MSYDSLRCSSRTDLNHPPITQSVMAVATIDTLIFLVGNFPLSPMKFQEDSTAAAVSKTQNGRNAILFCSAACFFFVYTYETRGIVHRDAILIRTITSRVSLGYGALQARNLRKLLLVHSTIGSFLTRSFYPSKLPKIAKN